MRGYEKRKWDFNRTEFEECCRINIKARLEVENLLTE
jgi:hypothetical protein